MLNGDATRRARYLAEMGLGPRWKLRDSPIGAGDTPVDVVADVAGDTPAQRAATVAPVTGLAVAPAGAIETFDWEQLEQAVRACERCVLCRQRRQAVPGVGDRRARWLFVGEGPGAEEDERGEPFVGAAGKLLDAMLAAIGLKRGEDVYIANAVKCRPPGNRTPEPDEMAACRPYLERQIALLAPSLIVLLGKPAAHSVLGRSEAIASLRGQTFDYRGIPVLVTYHPAYYLRSPLEKAKGWEDLCRARELMRASREADGEAGGSRDQAG